MLKHKPKDTLPPQEQERQPGRESEMQPQPDYEPRFPGSGRLRGKATLITGGDSGIGRAASVLFAREGGNVTIVYLEEDKDAEETKSLVEMEGAKCLLIKGDVGSTKFCADAVKRTVKEFGGLDVLVNNAAEQHTQDDVEDISEEQLEKTFRTNLFGYFYMTQAAMPHLKRVRRSSIQPRSQPIAAMTLWSTTRPPRVRSSPSSGRSPSSLQATASA